MFAGGYAVFKAERNSIRTGAHLRQVTWNGDLQKRSYVCTPDDIRRVIVHVCLSLEQDGHVVSPSTQAAVYHALVNSRVGLTTTNEALTLLVRNRFLGGL